MLRLLKIHGHSLFPDFREGDYVVVARFPFPAGRIKTGDVILFFHAGYGKLIKRVHKVLEDGQAFDVRGTQIESSDSRNFGPVSKANVFGKVIWHIRQD